MNIYEPHTVSSAPAQSSATLEAIRKGLGFLPNLFATMAESPAAVNGYVALDNVLAKGTLSSVERQLLLTTISSENACRYCTAAHSTLAGMFKADEASVAEARGESAPSATRQGALVAFTREVIRERGHVGADVLQSFFDAGFTKAQALEVVANIGLKTISNFIDGFAHVPLDAQFEARRWEPARETEATVRRFYESLARGDVPSTLGVLADSLEWTEAETFPYYEGTWRTPNEILERLLVPITRDWSNFAATPERFVSSGDHLVSLGRYTGTHNATGAVLDVPFAHYWRVANGRVVVFTQFTDTGKIRDILS